MWSSLLNWLPRSNPSPGQTGERLAAKHLKKLGYKILARNVASRLGEIDLLVMHPDRQTMVLVEVKTRVNPTGPLPEWRVGRAKQRKLTSLAAHFARIHHLEDRAWRIDVVGVDLGADWPQSKRGIAVRHLPGAVHAES